MGFRGQALGNVSGLGTVPMVPMAPIPFGQPLLRFHSPLGTSVCSTLPSFFVFFKLSHTGRAGFVSNLWVDSQAPSVLSLLFTSQTENHMTVTI